MSTATLDHVSRSPPKTPRRASFGADRFIPSSLSRNSLILGRHPDRLTPREKLTRTQSAGPDAFTAHVPRTPVRHRAGSSPASFGRGSGSPSSQLRRTSLGSPSSRRQSHTSVWDIGGGAHSVGDSVAGVPNGRGALLASGTNAHLFSSEFLRRRDTNGELDVHERRLAVALGLDTASRVFTYSNTPPLTPDAGFGTPVTPFPATPGAGTSPRKWRDGQWDRDQFLTSPGLHIMVLYIVAD